MTRLRNKPRRAYSLVELVVSMSTATVLMAGMGTSVYLANQAFRLDNSAVAVRSNVSFAEREMMADFQLATGFTERTSKAATFFVPDRDGDGKPELLRYAWSGVSGDPLTLSYNGGTAQTLVSDVRRILFTYQTQTLAAKTLPAELGGGTILLVVNDSTNLSKNELARKTLLESWNYMVLVAGANDPLATVANQASTAQAVYLCNTVNDTSFSATATQLSTQSMGIVNEHPGLIDELGLATNTGNSSVTQINLPAKTHYIATGLSTGNNTLYSSSNPTHWLISPAEDVYAVGTMNTSDPSLASLSKNRKKTDGSLSAGRRVAVPWGASTFDPNVLKGSGLTLMKQSVEWATGLGNDPTLTKSFGFQTAYASSSSTSRAQIATRVQLTDAGTLKSISAYVGGSSNKVKYAIYSDSSGEPNKLLAQSAMGSSGTSMGWITLTVPDTALTAGYYWLAFSYDVSTQKHVYDSSISSSAGRMNNNNAISNGFSSSWGSSTASATGARSIYATYTIP